MLNVASVIGGISRLAFASALMVSGVGAQGLPQPVTIAGSELRAMKSSNTGRDYDIYLLLPANYVQDPTRRYPVLYVLDGQWDFKLLASVQGGLLYDKFAPEMIIAGITYSGANPNYDILRALDLTTVEVPGNPGSGGAPKFLKFLSDELLPFMDANYRTDPTNRVLLGNSLGGLFTLYTLFTRPGLFSGYVASSPAVTSANRGAFAFEREYATTHKSLPGRVFVSVGEMEPLAQPVREFVEAMKARAYIGLEMESRVITGERHSGNKPESYNRGLRYVFGGAP
ncbi:MAG: alpha/beta hydrolase-fold protein [bacterium]